MFTTFNTEISILNKKLDIDILKKNALLEQTVFESVIDLESIKYNLILESTESKSDIYVREEKESLNTKINDIIKSTITIIEKFFSDLIDKVNVLFVKKGIENSIEKLKEKAKDPEIGTLKIEIPDFNGETRVIFDYKNNLKNIFIEINTLSLKVSKIKSNEDLDNLNKDWDDIKNKLSDEKDMFLKKHNAILDSTVTISVDNAVKLLSHSYSASVVDAALGKMKTSNIKDISGINIINDMDIKIMRRCLNMQVEISKIEGNLLVNSLTRLITAIFKGIEQHDN